MLNYFMMLKNVKLIKYKIIYIYNSHFVQDAYLNLIKKIFDGNDVSNKVMSSYYIW